jgi:hypothetical protein
MIKAEKPAVLLLYLFAEMLVQHFPHCVQPNFKLLFNQALLYASAADIILLIRMIVNHRHEVALVAVAPVPNPYGTGKKSKGRKI